MDRYGTSQQISVPNSTASIAKLTIIMLNLLSEVLDTQEELEIVQTIIQSNAVIPEWS